eukprot:CAMPEP_0175313632 /NCGR_PEP_ID=MMETSP0093-20121207/67981_1 /TAXON_ID=311494 /ORGANISM="Alexandrium monilatum, Strain CCMP3105" /LENGTH=72 /DNA_ID=CAMNT_0016610339 /DNA_START=29 /DNA_END=243 /DNA_ORIENTATION=+
MKEVVREAGTFDGGIATNLNMAGTGRHGGLVNPFADLQQAAIAQCLVHPGGLLLFPPWPSLDRSDGDAFHWL